MIRVDREYAEAFPNDAPAPVGTADELAAKRVITACAVVLALIGGATFVHTISIRSTQAEVRALRERSDRQQEEIASLARYAEHLTRWAAQHPR